MSTLPNRVPRLLTIAEVALHLRVCQRTVSRKIKDGDLRSHRVGNRIRIPESDVIAYLLRGKS